MRDVFVGAKQDSVTTRADPRLEWNCQDFAEAVEGVRHGYEDVRAGRTTLAAEFLADLRRKPDLPH
jgi:hypothetical protein